MSHLDTESIRKVFKQMDVDQSGTLDKKEMMGGLCKLGLGVEESRSLMETIDANGDGDISYDEVVEFLPEINSLLMEEREAAKQAEEFRKKRSLLEAKKRANAEAMEKRIKQKIDGINTDDANEIKRALAKALLVIDDLRAAQGDDAAMKQAELDHLRLYKNKMEQLHGSMFPTP